MSETMLRWKARLGSLKPLLGIALIFAILAVYREAGRLVAALNNPGAPRPVMLAQLVSGEVGIGRYVSVSGTADYDLGYEKTVDGKPTALYYFLIDPDDGAAVLIKHHATQLAAEPATITGMTRSAPVDLQAAIKQDARRLAARGQTATPWLYVEDGALPPAMGRVLLHLAVSIVIGGLCVAALFLPRAVFVSASPPAPASAERSRVQATGVFTELHSVEPLELGKRAQRFTNAVANIIPLGEDGVLLYIRYVLKTKTYGITTRTTVTDWGVYLRSEQDVVVSSGKLLGWRDKWAVRAQYPTAHGKPATLYLIFEEAGAQAACVALLRARRFTMRKRLKKFAA